MVEDVGAVIDAKIRAPPNLPKKPPDKLLYFIENSVNAPKQRVDAENAETVGDREPQQCNHFRIFILTKKFLSCLRIKPSLT